MIDVFSILDSIQQHAAECAPRECCGLAVIVLGKLRYWPCRNEHVGHESLFIMNPEDYAAAEDAGEIVAVVHSHVGYPATPSMADKIGIESSKKPWVIVNWPTGDHSITYPSGYKAPLLGRPWVHGVMDCYSLVRDYYVEKLGILLPDFDRDEKWWEKPGQNLYLDHFKEAGFVEVDRTTMREHDGILMMAGADRPNHGAVYIGGNMVMQHVLGRLSSRDVYGGWWRSVTTNVLRHKELL